MLEISASTSNRVCRSRRGAAVAAGDLPDVAPVRARVSNAPRTPRTATSRAPFRCGSARAAMKPALEIANAIARHMPADPPDRVAAA